MPWKKTPPEIAAAFEKAKPTDPAIVRAESGIDSCTSSSGCSVALITTPAASARHAPTNAAMKSTLDAGRSGADAMGDHDSASMNRMTAPETTPLPTANTYGANQRLGRR